MGMTLVQDAVSIVVKGPFNPAIFSPAWLESNGVIGEAERLNAKVELITQEVAKFTCIWLDVTVTSDALQLSTDRVEEFERLRDAMVATLDLLPHVPLGVMGINRSAHFDVGGIDSWHRIGDVLTPKDFWDGTLQLPGMKSLTIWGVRPDRHSGRIQVVVEPSSVIKFGIYVAHNDHFDLSDVESQPNTRADFLSMPSTSFEAEIGKRVPALIILRDEWMGSLKRASAVMSRVYTSATRVKE